MNGGLGLAPGVPLPAHAARNRAIEPAPAGHWGDEMTRSPFRRAVGGAALVAGAFLGIACSGGEPDVPPPATVDVDLSCPGSVLSAVPLRRLTRFEYQNAIADLFGEELAVTELLPRDELALGFDNQAATLSFTDLHVEGYLSGALGVGAALRNDPARLEALSGCTEPSEACARTLVERVGERVLRRSVTPAEAERLLTFFGGDYSSDAFAAGSAGLVTALLQSPEFLHRFERSPAPDGAVATTLASPWVLSSRLSFLLWGSVPDEALLAAAREGRLASAADVEREARRLLSDARAERGVEHFYRQWLRLTDFHEVEKDSTRFRIWSPALRADLEEETRLFLESVLWHGDARLSTLFTARYSFTNARLADFYGLPLGDPDRTELTRSAFPSGTPRAGILTHGSILATQAKPNQTDPIHRGKFVREQLFCQIPEPPPPDLVVSPPRLDPRKTTRERFSEHRSDPKCAGCHELLDPVGLIFEHYDAIGQYRATEENKPVDASGYLVETDVTGEINGVIELGRELARSADVRRCVVRQWFRYAFARSESPEDACTLDALDQSFESTGGNLRELLVSITQTAPFLAPSPAPEPEETP
jgi:hypothetical protein